MKEISKKIPISEHTTIKDIESVYDIKPIIKNGIYASYRVDNFDFLGEQSIALFYFENNKIKLINIHLKKNRENSWSTNTEHEEKKVKEFQDKLLLKSFSTSPPYSFQWGNIRSNYDSRSGSSNITISFNNKKKEKAIRR